MLFIRLRKFSSTGNLLSVFIMKEYCFFVTLCLLGRSYDLCLFILLIWYSTLIDFSYAEPVLHSWDKFYLVIVYNPFYMLLDLSC